MRIAHKAAALATTVAAVVAAVVVSGGAAQAAPFPYQEIGVFNSSHCLDNATEIDSVLQMWSCTGGDEQQWAENFDPGSDSYTFTNLNTQRCITAPPTGTGRVEMEPCTTPALSQRWRVYAHQSDASGFWTAWQNASSGMCLDTPSVANRTVLQALPCDLNVSYQKFTERGR
jgi:hypothetical protein